MRLDSVSSMPSACSATELALPPDWLTTSTPAAVQASTSTGSKPAPFEETIRRFGARFKQIRVDMEMRRDLVARRADLIGMRG